jgi:hypothetical protein
MTSFDKLDERFDELFDKLDTRFDRLDTALFGIFLILVGLVTASGMVNFPQLVTLFKGILT